MLRVLIMLAVSGALPANATSTERAWVILQEAVTDKSGDQRAKAARALGLTRKNKRAEEILEKALLDENLHVRVAAAKALGQIGAPSARPKLRQALNDSEVEVVIAAANSLYLLKDPTAYEVYYSLLTGARKSTGGLLHTQLQILKDRTSMEKLAFETAIGFVPFGGMGYEAWKTVTKDDTSPVRAAAAERLANDPDLKSGRALADACSDKKWRVRVAAVDAIAERGDPALIDALIPLLEDDNESVRYDAAAAILRLKTHGATRRSRKKRPQGITAPAPSQLHRVPSVAPK
jgi:HEAT repeat protein